MNSRANLPTARKLIFSDSDGVTLFSQKPKESRKPMERRGILVKNEGSVKFVINPEAPTEPKNKYIFEPTHDKALDKKPSHTDKIMSESSSPLFTVKFRNS